MAYRSEPPPDKGNFAKTGDLYSGLSPHKNTGDSGEAPPTIDLVIDDKVVAVLIDSTVLGAPIWFALVDDFKPDPGDKTPVFYASELPFLRTKTPEQLREIFKVKTAFGGAKVKQ